MIDRHFHKPMRVLMLRRFYDWMIAVSSSPRATWAMGAVAFAESSFFPFPPDVMLVPMSVARPDKAWTYAAICTLASVVGGIFGYLIGALLYDSVGKWLIDAYGYGEGVEHFRALYAEWGAWIILIKGLTPIPYKIVTITSGFAGYNLFWFVVLSLLTRAARFFILAGVLNYFGVPLRNFLERNLGLVTTVFLIILVGGVVVTRYLI
jgi:membrane protein YqaA with SNARE-associated domain